MGLRPRAREERVEYVPEVGVTLRELHRVIGRKLRAGFRDVRVDFVASPDDKGHLHPVVENMLGYAR